MESITKMTKYCLCILLLTIIQSCWTFESDIKEVETLIGNFKIILHRNDKRGGYILTNNHNHGWYQTIEDRCEQIYFDSTQILVKYRMYDAAATTHSYSRIKILDNRAKIETNGEITFQRKDISSKEFYKRVESCKDCVERQYSKSPDYDF